MEILTDRINNKWKKDIASMCTFVPAEHSSNRVYEMELIGLWTLYLPVTLRPSQLLIAVYRQLV